MADQGKPQGTLTTAPVQLKKVTLVAIGNDELDPQDKEVLCKAICYCNSNPNKGRAGQNLHQSCVSERLKELDKLLYHRSPYKPEISYDMEKDPPDPIMDKNILTKAHESVWGWIKKYWEGDKGYPYEAGQGMTRRPDVVIVKDPTKPPTQDNIKNVVEIKFGDDQFGKDQREDYEEIAGDPNKVKLLDPDECNCGNDNSGEKSTVVEYAAWAAAVIGGILQLRKGKLPKIPKFPSHKPAPAW